MRALVIDRKYSPKLLRLTDIRFYFYSVLFIAASVALPWSLHHFRLAGATFLPMHFFVLFAGLLYGWRVGLTVGLFSPLVSYGISGMPVLPILPQIVVELAAYGFTAGMLREKLNLRPVMSLLGAMAAGRLALLVYVLVASSFGTVYSPLGAANNAFAAAGAAISQGWPGIVIQLATIPFIVAYIEKKLRNKPTEGIFRH